MMAMDQRWFILQPFIPSKLWFFSAIVPDLRSWLIWSSVGCFGILCHIYSIFVAIPGRSTFPRCLRTCPTECSIFKSECSGLLVAVNLVNSSFSYNARTAGDTHSKNYRRSQPRRTQSRAFAVAQSGSANRMAVKKNLLSLFSQSCPTYVSTLKPSQSVVQVKHPDGRGNSLIWESCNRVHW